MVGSWHNLFYHSVDLLFSWEASSWFNSFVPCLVEDAKKTVLASSKNNVFMLNCHCKGVSLKGLLIDNLMFVSN